MPAAIASAYCWRQSAEAIWAASVGSVRNPPSISTAGTVASLRTAKRARFTPRSKRKAAQDSLIESCRQNRIHRLQGMAVSVLAVAGLRLPLSGWWRTLRRDGEDFQPGCTLPTGGIEMNADEDRVPIFSARAGRASRGIKTSESRDCTTFSPDALSFRRTRPTTSSAKSFSSPKGLSAPRS